MESNFYAATTCAAWMEAPVSLKWTESLYRSE
jgi:hypothetical protein